MATVRPSGAGDEAVGNGEVRNGGAVLCGGSNAAGIMTKNLSLADVADNFGLDFGSKVVANHGNGSIYTDKAGVIKAQGGASQSGTAGTTVLGYNSSVTEWVVKGGNITTTLGGVANTSLVSPAAGPSPNRDMVAGLETTRSLGDMVIDPLAAPSSGINSYRTITGGGTEKSYIDPAAGDGTTSSSDSAANATRAIPGELVYRTGAKIPVQDNYKSKESAES